jgi:hypothetical protein
MTSELLVAGKKYVQAGLTVIPVNAKKKPAIPEWKTFLNGRRNTLEDLTAWSEISHAAGWALICGEPSGGVAIIDFDVEGFYERWAAKVGELVY